MKKTDKEKWVEEFENLKLKEQIEVANEIIDNQKLDYEFPDSNYAKRKCKIVMEKLKEYIDKLNVKEDLSNTRVLLNKFNKLTEKNQLRLVNDILETYKDSIKYYEKEELKIKCSQVGHNWGKWKEVTITTFEKYEPCSVEDFFTNSNVGKMVSVDSVHWERKCKKCGTVEESETLPKEVKEEREEKRKQKKYESNLKTIQKLQKENEELMGKK